MKLIVHFLKDRSGSSIMEYGLILALISIVVVTAAHTMGSSVNQKFSSIATQMG